MRTPRPVFGDSWGHNKLHDMLREDPNLVDLAIGALMRYDP